MGSAQWWLLGPFLQQCPVQPDSNGEPVMKTIHLWIRSSGLTAAVRIPLAHEVLHGLGSAHHSTIPAASNLLPWIQAAVSWGFFLFLKCPSLSHLQPSHILFLLQPGLWLFLFLGANFHTSSPSWDITSWRKPSLNPWGRRALPCVFPQHVCPLHFTWLEWPASQFLSLDSELL